MQTAVGLLQPFCACAGQLCELFMPSYGSQLPPFDPYNVTIPLYMSSDITTYVTGQAPYVLVFNLWSSVAVETSQ